MINLIGSSVLSAVFYRMGGSDKFNPKWRDWGCALLTLVTLYVQGHQVNIIIYLVSFLLLWGALSTYWKFKAIDCKWYHWFIHGLGIGLSMFPVIFIGYNCNLIILRAITLGLTMMLWSEMNNNVFWEETGRGALIILTLPILGI